MSLDLGTLVGYLELDSSKWTKGTKTAESGLSGFASKGLKAIGGLVVGVAASGVAMGSAIGAIALKGGFSRALSIQDARASLSGLGNDAKTIDRVMSNALSAVSGTAFGLGDAAGVAATSLAAGIQPGKDLTRSLSLMADAATIAKLPLSDMGSMWNKVAANGKLNTEVMQQFQDAGIPVLQNVAKHFGVTNEAAQKMVTDGKVSFNDFQSIMEKQLGGAAKKSGDTARGSFANVYAALGRMGAAFATPAVAVAPILFKAIATATDTATKALGPLAERFSAWLTPAVTKLAGFIEKLDFAKIAKSVIEFSPLVQILKLLQPIIPTLLAAFAPLVPAIGDLAMALGGALLTILPVLIPVISQLAELLANGLTAALLIILPIITDLLNFIADNSQFFVALAIGIGLVTAAQWLLNAAMAVSPITWIIAGIVALIAIIVLLVANWDNVVGFITKIWGGFIAWITAGLKAYLTWWSGIWNQILNFARTVWDGFIGWITGLWSGFIGWIMDGLRAYLTWWIGIWGQILGFLQTAWNGAIAWLRGIPGWILGIFAGIGTWLLGIGRNLIGGLLNGVKGMWTNFLGFLRGIPGAIRGFFNGIGSWLWNAGRDLINGLLNGISSLAGSIGSFFLNLLPGWIVAPFKAALGIASPSKLFRKFGQNIAQGIPLGLDDEQRAIDSRMRELVTVPPLQPLSGARAAAEGTTGGNGRGGSGATAILEVHGNLGYSLDEVQAATDFRLQTAASLSGIDEEIGVA